MGGQRRLRFIAAEDPITTSECATFADDLCGINFFDAPAFEELSACLEQGCEQVGGCLEQKNSELCAG